MQLLTHRTFNLPKPTVFCVHPNGRRDVFVELESIESVAFAESVDFRLVDGDRNLILDSKRDRAEKKRSLADLVAQFRQQDPLLTRLLHNYNAAVGDPNNEPVYLFEIRDALAGHYGGGKLACTALGASSSAWSRLGQLCNDMPLRQGRHRGKAVGSLRDVTETELCEARKISRDLILSYLDGLAK